MEAIVFDDSPLAGYFEGTCLLQCAIAHTHIPNGSSLSPMTDLGRNAAEGAEESGCVQNDNPKLGLSSSTSSPSFAPRGRPSLHPRFRQNLPPLRLAIPQNKTVDAIQNICSNAVKSRLGRADNAKFLERFRYTIVASQLLNEHSHFGQALHGQSQGTSVPVPDTPQIGTITPVGAAATASIAFAVAWLIDWTRGNGSSSTGKGRVITCLAILVTLATISCAYMRRQWLQYVRKQILAEISDFATKAQGLDSAIAGALTLIQEVELVSRGYRMQLRNCFNDVIPRYNQACIALKPLAEEMDLEKYFDIYDISDVDFSEAMMGHSDTEFEDAESVRVLKILAARFYTTRKIFLCCLMALDAHGGSSDSNRWSTAVDEVHGVSIVTGDAGERLCRILGEEETRERLRAQLRKLNSLSSGIRGLQAKMHVLREESDRNLNETEDFSELGTHLMVQYESVGVDLKALMQEWEDGKAALAFNIDRNERRVSSMSGMLSPTVSLGGLTAVEEGSVSDALKALNGEPRSRNSLDFSCSDVEEVFEAVAIPRQRSTLTREERIVKMKEDRLKRESLKSKSESNTKMLRELESVINMRPRGRTTVGGRITSI
ncbi:hypothetical protein QTJ16_004318 [Diplocarpon rosae]|uniref:Myosin-binding domain-containing protein n=1 Tax=Diplocarpon rosae TaxID=946125 RepID=A0AAD9WEA0_9HELO|nr:hypothetical protein QTJ16_004318 [Diplocarpon rosae]